MLIQIISQHERHIMSHLMKAKASPLHFPTIKKEKKKKKEEFPLCFFNAQVNANATVMEVESDKTEMMQCS